MMTAYLYNMKHQSSSLLKKHNHAKKKEGFEDEEDKQEFKSLLSSLGETASNYIKLLDEIGENVDVIYASKDANTDKDKDKDKYQGTIQETIIIIDKEKNKNKKYTGSNDEDDNNEESDGVGIDAYDESSPGIPEGVSNIAEAKPIGLAVVGEHGLAASRPVGTAVASSGIAIARPVGTAISGIDPTLLGINFQLNKS